MKQCQILLEEPDIETAVRIGDIYGIMIEHLARQQNYSKVSLKPRLNLENLSLSMEQFLIRQAF